MIVKDIISSLIYKYTNKKPVILDFPQHKISKKSIDNHAYKVVHRLHRFGYEAYIVGGAVRDFLFSHQPKDFDVVTNAKPSQIRKIFHNSRIIGRRFKLVHIYFKDCIIETATFRADCKDKGEKTDTLLIKRDNVYGTIEDDFKRRDFTINALYYNPIEEKLIDYIGAFQDIQQKRIKTIKNPAVSFLEDPVRMIRAAKYAAIHKCSIDEKTVRIIQKHAVEITKCSKSRLYEEINKVMRSKKSSEIIEKLSDLQILKYLLPFLNEDLDKDAEIFQHLKVFDKQFKHQDHYILYFWVIFIHHLFHKSDFANTLTNIQSFIEESLVPIQMPKNTCIQIAQFYYHFLLLINKRKTRNKKINYIQQVQFMKILKIDHRIIHYCKMQHKTRYKRHKQHKVNKVSLPIKSPVQIKKMVITDNLS
ncbi:MAG: polynucleotide adenylyltransferase PcnB [Spirochaetes bacterium]|nr:polynucleotide adenylyltransferase PcnB [Spirochaetota bacterium]